MLDRLRVFRKLLSSAGSEEPADISTLAPERPLLVVGDVHGRFDLMRKALTDANAFIDAKSEDLSVRPQLVFAGDYVDRGERSAEVLEALFALQQEVDDRVTCIMGNHERMLLEFLDDPAGRGQRWLRNGGLQTLSSYRIGNVHQMSEVEALTEASMLLEEAMPNGMVHWLRNLPLMYQSGNVCVVHAAMDPHLDPADQSSHTLLWGHNEFMTTPREDNVWVVHGHTIVPQPTIRRSRISIDTGAYHSGRLTVAAINTGTCEFIQTSN